MFAVGSQFGQVGRAESPGCIRPEGQMPPERTCRTQTGTDAGKTAAGTAFDGTIRDEDGYICVACDYDYYGYGEVVETSIGWGKVYDTGCAYGTVDIYTDW